MPEPEARGASGMLRTVTKMGDECLHPGAGRKVVCVGMRRRRRRKEEGGGFTIVVCVHAHAGLNFLEFIVATVAVVLYGIRIHRQQKLGKTDAETRVRAHPSQHSPRAGRGSGAGSSAVVVTCVARCLRFAGIAPSCSYGHTIARFYRS